MKKLLLLIALLTTIGFSQITYYGITGYNYTPNAYTEPSSSFGFLVGSKQTNLQETNMIFNYLAGYGVIDILGNPLEIAVSNTPGFVSNEPFENAQEASKGYGSIRPGYPIPAIKYSFHHQENWAVAGGLTYNYGLYCISTYRLALPFVSPEITGGLGYAVSKAYVMGGLKLTASDFSANPLPFALIVEAASGGSTKILGEVDEFFVSTGFQSGITDNLTLAGNYRVDPSPYYVIDKDNPDVRIKKASQNTNGLFTLSIIFTHKNL